MKKLLNISGNFYFYILASSIFMIHFSIAYCSIAFSFLIVAALLHVLWYRPRIHFPRPFLLFLPFIVFTLNSSFFSMEPGISFKDNRDLLIFLIIPIVHLIVSSRKRLKVLLAVALISAGLSSILGIYRVIQMGDISLDSRPKGLTSHWMTYTGLLMLAFIFFFIYVFYEKRRIPRVFTAIVLSVIGLSMVFSLTRSAWMGAFAALGLFALYYQPKIIKYAIPALVLLAIMLPAPVKNRVISIFDLGNQSNRTRIVLCQKAFHIFQDYPLAGVGCNYVGRVLTAYDPPFSSTGEPGVRVSSSMHLHNNFIQILAARGIFTLAAFLFAFITLQIDLWKRIPGVHGILRVVPAGVFFMIIGFLTAGLFEYNFGDTEILYTLLFFVSLPYLPLKGWSHASSSES